MQENPVKQLETPLSAPVSEAVTNHTEQLTEGTIMASAVESEAASTVSVPMSLCSFLAHTLCTG